MIEFIYNEKDQIKQILFNEQLDIRLNLDGIEYFNIRNLQGDLVKLVDATGKDVVTYTYTSRGEIINQINMN